MDLSNQTSIGSALLIAVSIPGEPVTTFSTYWRNLTVDSVTYTGLGSLLSVSQSSTNIRATGESVTVSISGIPSTNLDFVENDLLRGSAITIRRYVFDPVTGEGLAIAGNPAGRFVGVVSNYNINFAANNLDRSGTVTLDLICDSQVEMLSRKRSGRRTTPEDQRRWFPGDLSMDRVPTLARSNFDFGVPK